MKKCFFSVRARSEPKSTFYGGSIRGQFSMTSQEQIGSGINHVYSVSINVHRGKAGHILEFFPTMLMLI